MMVQSKSHKYQEETVECSSSPMMTDQRRLQYDLLWRFKDQEDQESYSRFQEGRTNWHVLVVFSISCFVAFFAYGIQELTNSRNNATVIIRLFRIISVMPGFAYIFFDFKRRRVILPTSLSETDCAHSWVGGKLKPLANLVIMWFALAGGLMLLQRSLVGKCTADLNITECNPAHERHGLPTDALLVNLLSLICIPAIFKAHSSVCVLISYIIAIGFIVASAIAASAYNLAVVLTAISVALAFVLYDFESSMMSLYICQQNALIYNEEALRASQSKKASELENESLCSLIGNVAHDLKTPLQSFMSEIGNLESLLDPLFRPGLSAAEMRDIVQRHQKGVAGTMSSLKSIYSFMMLAINRGIDFRKAMAGLTLQPRQETFVIAEAVAWAVSCFEASPTGVSVRVVEAPKTAKLCPMVISDKHWFSENILSLVSNAMKYTMSGTVDVEYRLTALTQKGKGLGSVVVHGETSGELFSPVTGSTIKDGAKLFLLVLVQDSGIGIPLDQMSTLFQPFRQAQRRAGGTGLGLFSISKRMEALHGHCGVQGREDGGKGSCFWLAYPYVPDWEADREQQRREASSNVNTMKFLSRTNQLANSAELNVAETIADSLLSHLADRSSPQPEDLPLPYPLSDDFWRRALIVEDSLLILKAVTRLLKKEGFEVDVAQNGAVGLEKMKAKQYVLVLSDIQMPVMDGNEMVMRLREYEAEPSGPQEEMWRRQFVVGMSANSDVDTERAAIESGMNQFVPKPVAKLSLQKSLFAEYMGWEDKGDNTT